MRDGRALVGTVHGPCERIGDRHIKPLDTGTQLLSVTIMNYHRRENHQVARLELILELNVKAPSRKSACHGEP